MQFPIDLHLGALTIPSHFIFNILAVSLGVWYYQKSRRENHTTPKHVRQIIGAGGFFGALLGARLVDFADAYGTTIYDQLGFFSYALLGGKTIVGALAGGIITIEILKWLYGVRRSVGDDFTFPIIYGIIIGRVGCFLTGVADDTVGSPSSLPWAFDQGDGIPRHPTALYEIVFLGIFWLVLVFIKKRVPLAEGILFRLFIGGYFLFRLCIDFLKPYDPLFLGMTAIQLVSILFVLWYAIDIVRKQFFYGPRTA